MCVPIIAMALATTALSIKGQRDQAKTQEKVQKLASTAERQRYLQEVSSMRVQQGQEELAAAQRINESAKKAREARATARVSAGESGVAGLSVNALIADIARQEAEFNVATQQQTKMNDVGRTMQLQNSGLGFTNNMLRINRPIEQPNYIGAILDGAQTGMSTYSTFK